MQIVVESGAQHPLSNNTPAVLGTKKERTMRGVQQKNVKYKSS